LPTPRKSDISAIITVAIIPIYEPAASEPVLHRCSSWVQSVTTGRAASGRLAGRAHAIHVNYPSAAASGGTRPRRINRAAPTVPASMKAPATTIAEPGFSTVARTPPASAPSGTEPRLSRRYTDVVRPANSAGVIDCR